MSLPLFAVYGAGGCGRGVLPLAREQVATQGLPMERLIFVDDAPAAGVVNGHTVVTYAEFLRLKATERFVTIAIADSFIRRELGERCAGDGVQPWTVVARNVVLMDDVQMDVGAILSPFVTITSNVRIGRFFHGNLYSYVEHDCVIGDFVTFAPGVKCNGNVVIEDHAYVGTGALIKQGRPDEPLVVGRGAIVGMGAVVTKSVTAGETVVGNPARPLNQD